MLTADILESEVHCTETVMDKKGTILYLSEYFHFSSQCHSTDAPHSHSLTHNRRSIFLIATDSVAK